MSSWSLETFDGMPFSSVSLSFRFFTASFVFVEFATVGLVVVVAALNDVEEDDDEAIESLRDRFV